jgi:flavin reductase (DIM6/NTAB) family NADH-FMN oxidoreductase RutF
MSKLKMGPQTLLYTRPIVLVGADVNDKPNFAPIAWAGIACGEPPMISVALRHNQYTLKGIRQNLTFSVNTPSTNMVKETDYCGLVSGSKSDKVKDCRFKVFYGNLDSAPLIEQCPINLECEVAHILDLGSHALVIGRIKETHISENCLTDEKPDIRKIKPMIYDSMPSSKYHAIGEFIADAFSIGKELEASNKS